MRHYCATQPSSLQRGKSSLHLKSTAMNFKLRRYGDLGERRRLKSHPERSGHALPPPCRSPSRRRRLGVNHGGHVPKKIAPDSTIATVWPRLTHQRDYVAGSLNAQSSVIPGS